HRRSNCCQLMWRCSTATYSGTTESVAPPKLVLPPRAASPVEWQRCTNPDPTSDLSGCSTPSHRGTQSSCEQSGPHMQPERQVHGPPHARRSSSRSSSQGLRVLNP